MLRKSSKIIISSLLLVALPMSVRAAVNNRSKTMLMFVGEDLGVITIASRRAENAFSAPAVAETLSHEELQRRGIKTISEALNKVSGFYMAPNPQGSQPYLRGLKNSILFLYDGVPLNSTMSKNIHPLDDELSLNSVRKIEIIKGPGSVLWGPDAYAGIVNITPMKGSDINGLQAGISLSAPDHGKRGYILYGHNNNLWDTEFSLEAGSRKPEKKSYSLSRFWNDGISPTAPEQRFSGGKLSSNKTLELGLNVSYKNWLSLTGHFSDYNRDVVEDTPPGAAYRFSWPEEHAAPQYFFKVEAKKKVTAGTTIRGTLYYRNMDINYQYIDFCHKQEERNYYGELLIDHQMFNDTAIFTAGFSRRYTQIRDALAWDSYPMDYIVPENTYFLPTFRLLDFSNRLNSTFVQYNQKIGEWSLTGGLRFDDHQQYENKVSANAGIIWHFSHDWMSKLLYGQSYRTPFARQLADNFDLQLEEITTLQSQLIWRPSSRSHAQATIFQESLKNHVVEDSYYGLSQPGSQRINGLEMSAVVNIWPTIDVGADLTLIKNSGELNKFMFNDYTIITKNNAIKHYITEQFPFDPGPETMGGINITWHPELSITLVLDGRYHGSTSSHVSSTGAPLNFDPAYTLDITFTKKFIQYRHDVELEIHAANIFNQHYEIPGPNGAVEAPGIWLQTELRVSW